MKIICSYTVYICLSTKSTLEAVGSPSAANCRSPNVAQYKGNNWVDNFSEAQKGIKILFHMPHLIARVIVFPLSLSLKVCYFCQIKTNTSRKNIQNHWGVPSLNMQSVVLWRSRVFLAIQILLEDSNQTVRMRMLIWIFAGHAHVPHLICRALGSFFEHNTFGVLAFPVSLLTRFRVGLFNWLKYLYLNVCKGSCSVF